MMRPDARRRVPLASTAFALLATGIVAAQSLPPGLLSHASQLPGPTRAELERHAAALAAMTPVQRDAFRQRIAAWDAQVPALQRERRDAWQAWRSLPGDEQARLRAAVRDYAADTPERQQALRARFDALDGSERRGWLLGPVLGADYPKLHALLAQVPGNERAPLLAAVRALSPEGRADLAVLAQRVPPQERDALRTQWLAVPVPQREAWLRARLRR